MKKLIVLLLLTMISGAIAQETEIHSYKPPNGFVPDKETAIKIALSVWIPIYGKKNISKQKPYIATLSNGIWTIRGSLQKDQKGGVAQAEISKDSGCILRVSHGK